MTRNSNLTTAKRLKNDEFYTQIQDIQAELQHYEEQFAEKEILCNCNDGESSGFWIYLSKNFERLKLKKLTCISYSTDAPAYSLEIRNETSRIQKKALQGNGDFRNPESIAFLENSDIVITNPPFSIFREYFSLLMQYHKKFLIVGSLNAVTYKEVFPHLKIDEISLGINQIKGFIQKNDTVRTFGNIVWYTNMKSVRPHKRMILKKNYSPLNYPDYDNLSAIEVGKVSDIPADYYGVMGVPVSFLTKYSPEQFELIGLTSLGQSIDSSLCIRKYKNVFQHGADGKISNGSKTNTSAVIRVRDKPTGTYYTADNVEGYLISKFVRVLIKRREYH